MEMGLLVSTRSKNKSGGPEGAAASKQKKAATAPKGRHTQKRGSGDHNTSPYYGKMQRIKGSKSEIVEDMEF